MVGIFFFGFGRVGKNAGFFGGMVVCIKEKWWFLKGILRVCLDF